MSVRVNFILVHPWFREPVSIPVDWKFPFLPKVGESVSGWIWVQQGNWEQSEIEKELSEEGKKDWESYRSRNHGFDGWLNDNISMDCGRVFDICYSRHPNMPPNEILVDIYMNEDGQQM